MSSFQIRTIAGGAGGVILGGAHLLFEIQDVPPRGKNPRSQRYSFTGIGATVGVRAGGYGPSQWTDFEATCGLNDFHGYTVLSSIQGGPVGASKLSFISGPASGTEVIGYGWGISTDVSISFVHGLMRRKS